jgi:hypothetical protein
MPFRSKTLTPQQTQSLVVSCYLNHASGHNNGFVALGEMEADLSVGRTVKGSVSFDVMVKRLGELAASGQATFGNINASRRYARWTVTVGGRKYNAVKLSL